jgi:hypothetical protein
MSLLVWLIVAVVVIGLAGVAFVVIRLRSRTGAVIAIRKHKR